MGEFLLYVGEEGFTRRFAYEYKLRLPPNKSKSRPGGRLF